MVYRKRRMRRKPRRRMRRRRRRIPKSLFGNSKSVVLKYAAAGQLNPVAGPGSFNWISRSFSANNVKFPDTDNPTLHPSGWLQIRDLYDRVTVLGSKITLVSLPGANVHNSVQYIDKSIVDLDGNNSQLIRRVLNNRNVRYGFITQARGGQSKVRTSMTFSAKKFFHKKDVLDCEELSQGTGNLDVPSAPVQECFYNVGASTTHIPATALANLDYLVTISYYCVFHSPVNPNDP